MRTITAQRIEGTEAVVTLTVEVRVPVADLTTTDKHGRRKLTEDVEQRKSVLAKALKVATK